jgi:hypothetical protein
LEQTRVAAFHLDANADASRLPNATKLRMRPASQPFWLIDQTCRLLTCGLQSGRTSAPIIPHRVQTIRGQSDRICRLAS